MNGYDNAEARPTGAGSPASQEVSWWATHIFITELVAQSNATLPWAGTPSWRALDDRDPRKLLALALAGEHHVLRVETAQHAVAEAGEAISGAANWSSVAQLVKRRREIDELRRFA